jgi:cytochrome P450
VTQDALSIVDLMSAGPMDPIEDVHSVYARLRREDPVHRLEAPLNAGVFVSRFADVHTVLKDDETFSSRSNGERGIALVMGRTLIGMDGREHLRHRALITPSLAPRALRGDFPKLVDRIAQDLIDGFAEKSAADLVTDFTFVYPLRVFTEILGLPPDDVRTFHDWAIDLSHVARDPQRGLASSAKMKDYLAPVVAEKRASPSDDLISKVATAEVDGVRLTDEEVISFLRLLVIAGAETTFHLLGSALFALLRDPALLEDVRADRGRIAALLDETLRWESPVQIITRECVRDTVLSGVEIPSGTDIIVGIGSANRDESRFPDADRFDIDRQGEPHIAFGFGKHYCAGSRFALLEATVAIEALLDRLPELRADPDAPPARVVGIAFRGPDQLPVRFASTGATS